MDISYKGTNYHGWQIQPNGNTVQAELEKALSTILKTTTAVTGSGRTDTGVHATQQIAHFECEEKFEPSDLAYKLNSFLPKDISINAVKAVIDDAHARFSAEKRKYHYHLNGNKNPFLTEQSYYFSNTLNIEAINRANKIIESWQNFECFSKVHTEVNNFVCTIFEASWKCQGDKHIFSITANRFLRGMVRAIVGTLIDVGTEKKSLSDFEEILKSNDRKQAGRSVPAHGLFLQEVTYSPNIYL